MARTCSASTAVVARSGVAGLVVLGGGPCAGRTGCLRGGGSDPDESVTSISGAVAVGRALSRCFERFGLVCLSDIVPFIGATRMLGVFDVSWSNLRQRAPITPIDRLANQSVSVLRGSQFRRSLLVRRLPGYLL